MERTGSKEAGHKRSAIEAAVNTHANFAVIPRDQRSVRERFNKLISDFNTIMQKEEKAFGISPDDLSELDQILLQQRQLQQQMEAQSQSQALLMALLAKMNKS